MTQAAASYLRKGDDLENFRRLSEGIYETQEQKQIELEIQDKHSPAKITCLSIGAVAFFALGMVALIFKRAHKMGVGSILLSLPLFLFALGNIQSRNLLKKRSFQTTKEIFSSLSMKIYMYSAAKEIAVRDTFKGKIFTNRDDLVIQINEFAKNYDNTSLNIGLYDNKLRIEIVQMKPFIQKIAHANPALSELLNPQWQQLQKACRVFLRTGQGANDPFVALEENSGVWKVKPAAL